MKKIYSFILLAAAFLCLPWSAKAETLTVADDTWQKNKLPIDSYNCDAAQHNQFIFPATELGAMTGKIITGIKFHTVNASYSWSAKGSPTFTFKFAEVEGTTLSGFNTEASFTTVYTGQAVFANNAWDITLDDSYSYQGGNLLIDVSSAAAGYISTVNFYSKEYASAGWANGTGNSYLPKTTFTYEAVIEGPGLKVADGATKLTSGANYSFGLAAAGTEKTFTLSNPGTESITLNIAATNGFGVSPANVTIAAKAETTLTVTMANATGEGVVTITPVESVDPFTINVSGTVRDASKLWCNFSEGLPEGWTNSSYTISTTGGGDGTSGGGYAGNTNYSDYRLYTPKVTIAEGEKLYLLVAGHGSTASWNSMQVQYSADGAAWTTAKAVSDIAKGSWTSVEVTEIPAGSYYIGFYGKYYYLTDIYGGTPAALVKNVAASSITDTEATISWTAHGSETAWQVSYSTTSGDPSNGTIVDATSTSKTIEGLSATTTYYVSVRIGNSGEWSNEISFTTACGAETAPYKWTFESESNNTVPTCWDNSASTSTNSASEYYYVWGVYNYSSNKSIRMCNYNVKPSGGSIAQINTPRIVIPASPVYELAFDYSHTSNAGDLTVKISKDNGSSWTDLQSYSKGDGSSYSDPGTFTEASIDLNDYAGETIMLQFYAPANYGNGAIFVDNVEIREKSSCAAPKNVLVSSITANTASVAWTEKGEATAWKLQTSTDGTEWSEAIAADANPFTLTGLTAETTYYVRVAADCGGETSAWSDPSAAFTTLCETATLPFETEGFDAIPNCWSVASAWGIYTYDGNSNSTSIRVKSTTADLTTPLIELSDKAQLSFYLSGSNSIKCYVYVNDGENVVKAGEATSTTSWKQATVDLSAYTGKTVNIIFRSSSSSYYLYLDDIAVDYKPVAAVTNVVATPANTQAVVTWECAEEEAAFSLRYRVKDAEPEAEWTLVENINAKTYTITELTNGTAYEVQVKAVASANRQSDWTASATVTPQACPSVETVTFGAATYNSVVVNWTTSGAGTWDLRYKAGDGEWALVENIDAQTTTLSNLTTGAVYTIAVKPSCSDADEAWVAAAGTITLVYTAPAGLAASAITDAAATISWDAVADAAGYEYKLGEGAWTATAEAATSANLTELAAGTEYTFYVRATYPTGNSAEAEGSFTTVTIAPKNLTSGEITTTTATFTWEANGAATKYQWSTDNTNWSDAQTELTATATGLTAATTYTFYVRSYYSETVQSAAVSLQFTTECDTYALPFAVEGFDHSGALPNCWDNSDYTGNQWTMAAYNYYKSPYYSARYNARTATSNSADLKTPAINLSEKAVLTFYYKNNSSVTAEVLVYDGEKTDTALAAIPATSGTATVMTAQATVDLSEYAGKTVNIIFRGHGKGSTSAYLDIDDVTVTYKPIAAPTALAAAPADASATITWTNIDETAAYNLQYKAVEAAEWATVNGVTSPYVLTGLTNGTAYEVQLQAVASANRISEWTASANFTPVACANVTAVTFGAATYNSVVVNWTADAAGTWALRYKAEGDADWTTISPIAEQTKELTGLATGVAYTVAVKPTCNDADEAWVAAEETVTLVYTAPANLTAGAVTDAAATISWDAVADAVGYEYKLGEGAWTATAEAATSVNLTELAAGTEYTFYVRATYPTGNSAEAEGSFTTITIAPQNLAQVGASTTTTASFSWEANGAATQYQWSVDGENWSEPQTELTATAEDLTAGTAYTFYVRSYYSETVQSAAVSLQFTTECAAFALPFAESFENAGLPNCWESEAWSESVAAGKWSRDNSYSHSGYALRFHANTASSASVSTPEIVLDKKARLSFYIRNAYGNSGSYISGKVVAVDVANEANKVEADFINSNAEKLSEQTIDLSDLEGKTVQIIFHATGVSTNASLYLDDVTVTEIPVDPTGLINTSVDAKTVKLIENDQLVIIRDGVRYNAQGAKLN